MLLEIACFNYESALIAQKAGADRIELCEDYNSDGITPSLQLFEKLRGQLPIPVFIMIRPRAGNFEYTDAEFDEMKKEILQFKDLGANGFVFGIIEKNKVNVERCKELVTLADPLPCTFHRAFDEITDHASALEDVISCGFKRILTSGKKHSAFEGSDLIGELVQLANNRILIVPGGRIRSENISLIKIQTGASEFHSSAILDKEGIANESEIKKLKLAICE
jgi:copper homeostasis protein